MPVYRKFSDVQQSEAHVTAPPKPAKAPKVDQIGAETLAGLGALGGNEPQTRNSAPLVSPIDPALAPWGEAEQERAAIVEYDGSIPCAWAEGFARLHPDRPPGDVPAKRWLRFIDDVGLFLDSPFCAVAAALGWGPLDLFGCDRDRPFARIDHAGILWLLNGDRLAELDRHRAVIERRTGAFQTFRRGPITVGEVVLAWELVA
jgi:hypothetical protein